jgi:hypothetical protein
MKKLFSIACLGLILLSCNDESSAPDVSDIRINIKVLRFEHDLFALDTHNIIASAQQLNKKYPGFAKDFFNNILGLNGNAILAGETQQITGLKTFIQDYSSIKDSSVKVFRDFSEEEKAIIQSLRYVKYYFPSYKTPPNLITFIGPIDAFFETSFGTQGDIITADGLAVGLQLHLGNNFSFYKSEQGLALYPEYISKTFTPEYIAVNSMKNIIDDMYPSSPKTKPLIDIMVERGKRLYILDRLLPSTPAYIKMSYTKQQMEDVYKNEAVIWDFFLRNDLLNNEEQNIIKNYIGESPKTQEFGDNSPGNLGSFTGWQIVKKFMNKHTNVSLDSLMKIDAREVYALAKYRPKI